METMETESASKRKAKCQIYNALAAVQDRMPAVTGRVSRKGVPHLVGTLPSGRRYSICYFKRHRGYTVFFPYGEFKEQEKVRASTPAEVEGAVERLVSEHA